MDSLPSIGVKFNGDLMTNIIQTQTNPYFYATLASPVNAVTGDATVYTLRWDTLTAGSGYNTGTGLFTCSVPGEYLFIGVIYVTGLTSSHTTAQAAFVVNTTSYQIADFRPSTGRTNTNTMIFTPCTLSVLMAAGDTLRMDMVVYAGTKVVNFDTLSTLTGVRLPS